MSQKLPEPSDQKRKWFNLALAGVAAQTGCLTLVIVLAALFGGLWLDAYFHTRPTITLIFVIASIPISLIAMFLVVRTATARIKANLKNSQE